MRLGLTMGVALAASAMVWSAPASAQPAEPAQQARGANGQSGAPTEAEPTQQKGTHFVLEANGGATVTGGVGVAGGLVLGAGAKPVGFPWRFYVVGELAYLSAGGEGELPERGEGYHESRRYLDMALGLRIYIPVYGPMRLFVDALTGGSYSSATLTRDVGPPLTAKEWNPLGVLGGGVQARILHQMSVGVRATLRFTGDGLGDLRNALQVETPRPVTLQASMTWHF